MKPHDLFEQVKSVPVGVSVTAVAAGAGDNTEVVGSVVDTLDAHSATLTLATKVTLTAAKDLLATIKVAESDDGSVFGADETLLAAGIIVEGGAGVVAQHDCYDLKIDLRANKTRLRYLRFKITPDLTHTSLDTAQLCAFLTLGGYRVAPVTRP